MSRNPETGFVQSLRTLLEEEFGGFWFKYWGGPLSDSGIPDLLGCTEGTFLGIEAKYDTNTPSPIQIYVLRKIIVAGGIAFPTRCKDRALAAVDEGLVFPKRRREIYLRETGQFFSDGDGDWQNFDNLIKPRVPTLPWKRR